MSLEAPLRETTLEAFLDALASKSPVPGGGALAALSLAQAAALASMVVEYSIGKPSLAHFDSALRDARLALEGERERGLVLMEDDAAAYASLRDAFSLPKDDPARSERIRDGARRAIAPPREVLDRAGRLLQRLADLVSKTSPPLRSDLAVAGAVALAAAESGAFNVRANLPLLGGEGDERASVDRAHGASLAKARDAKTALDASIEAADAARR